MIWTRYNFQNVGNAKSLYCLLYLSSGGDSIQALEYCKTQGTGV